MRVLRMGDNGPEVIALQHLLQRYDSTLRPDGHFGTKTEKAVRTAQRRLGLFPPDGAAGPVTLGALAKATKAANPAASASTLWDTFKKDVAGVMQRGGQMLSSVEKEVQSWFTSPAPPPPAVPATVRRSVAPAKQRATTNAPPPGEATDAKLMRLSLAGRQFIFSHEAGDGRLTQHPHHPNDNSGVTIGAGYDMRERTPQSILSDLTQAGVRQDYATRLSASATLFSGPADTFCANNHDITVPLDQQVALLKIDEPKFENRVRRAIKVPLHQYQFDALVSYAGNPGTKEGWENVVKYANANDGTNVVAEMHRHTTKKVTDKAHKGLVKRRDDEGRLYLYGEYK